LCLFLSSAQLICIIYEVKHLDENQAAKPVDFRVYRVDSRLFMTCLNSMICPGR
jgi:hypothetical protein